ncbi:MAG: Gfo/Idh/MocA family oxidoreductase [Clostridia bacterium]|nr:Gfo/Idh/MocA family oxidoreductase [Clostridia bacterium]
MNKMKIGVLGVSNHFLTRIVLPLMQSDKVEIYGIASRNIEKAKDAANRFGIKKHYGSYDDLLQDSEIEAVFIPLPNHMHKDWIYKCIDAEKHVLCEKPLTMNAAETVEVMEYVKNSKYKVMEAFMYRFHPKWQKAKDLVDLGYIGKVTQIHTVFSYNNQDPTNIRNIKEVGGGALMDIGCYAINSARFILGKAPLRAISLMTEHDVFKTDSITSSILDFGDSRALFTTSTTSFPQQEVKIYGTSGMISVTIPFNDISEIKGAIHLINSQTNQIIEFEPANQYLIMFDAFADAINNNSDLPFSLQDSLENMKTIDAVFESAETGAWVSIK